MTPIVRRTAAASAAVLLAAALGRADGSAAQLPDVCPGAQVIGDTVRCTALFRGASPLRLPADPSDTQRYGAFRRRGGEVLVTRSGVLKLEAGLAAQVAEGATSGGAYARTVYLATVSGGVVTALKPAVTITESAIMRHVFAGRALEGRIGVAARRKGTFTDARTLPIRVELAERATDGILPGRIVNARRPVRAADDRCLAPLSRSGARNPLAGRTFTSAIALQRRPSMHTPFDDQLIARWNASASDMGTAFYPSVATLLGRDPLGPVWVAQIHGVPSAGPSLRLRLVTGGGGRCR